VRLSLGSVTETIFEQKSGPLTIIENRVILLERLSDALHRQRSGA